MQHEITVECPVFDSFRVRQVAGMFDLPLQDRVREVFQVELPSLKEWRMGLIVGPSGRGKSSVARAVYGADLYTPGHWPADQAVIDCLADRPTKDIARMLTAVGLSSPPAWIKPYAVLSGGEQFRCDLAKALLTDRPLVVFDEFTSVVDRTAASLWSGGSQSSDSPQWPAATLDCSDLSLRCGRVAGSGLGLGSGNWPTCPGVSSATASSWKSFAADTRLGPCLAVITI